jgi:hypothetical protein
MREDLRSPDAHVPRPLSPQKCTDATCPCQDGDACHYEATKTTSAWSLPPGVYRLTDPQREALGWLDSIGKASPSLVTAEGYSLGTVERLVQLGVVIKRVWPGHTYYYHPKGAGD